MSTESMLSELQNVYNFKYNDTQIKYMTAWLNKKTDTQRRFIFAELLNFFTPTNATPLPFIAELNKAWRIVTTDRWHEVKKIETKNKPRIDDHVVSEEEAKENIARVYELIGCTAEAKRLQGECNEA